jgi:hypothetical protein|tara:strand:- start:373 stop:606 length:234 start_codon:yes stop_codon:yes gene_type:complete
MDTQTLINLGGAIILAGMGWLARELWGAVKELRKDLHTIEVALPSNYIRKDEFQEGVKELKDICRQIFERLENKADK